MKPGWFQNGARTESLPIDDRGLQYGDGLFETIAVRGGKLRLWELHAERLQSTCQRLLIDVPTTSDLLQQATDAIDASEIGNEDALLKIIVTRGRGERGYTAPANAAATVLIGVFVRTNYAHQHYQNGVKIRYCEARWSVQPQTTGMKLLSRLDQVRARSEWQDPDVVEGLMLDYDDCIVGGTMSNLFIVENGALFTPQITQCGVSGVMRRHILALAGHDGLSCTEARIQAYQMATADEIFLCNSQFGIWPVSRCGNKDIAAWPMTRRLMTLLWESGVREGRE